MYFKFGSGYNSSTSRAAHKAVSHTAYLTARSLVLAKGKSKAKLDRPPGFQEVEAPIFQ
jgi:hypothetical protein